MYQEDAVEIFATPNAAVPGNYYGYEMNINGTLLDYIAFDGGKERTKAIHPSWQSEGVVIATTYDGTLNDHFGHRPKLDSRNRHPPRQLSPLGWTDSAAGRRPMAPPDSTAPRGYQGQFGLWSDTGTPKADFHRATRFGILTFSTAVVGR